MGASQHGNRRGLSAIRTLPSCLAEFGGRKDHSDTRRNNQDETAKHSSGDTNHASQRAPEDSGCLSSPGPIRRGQGERDSYTEN